MIPADSAHSDPACVRFDAIVLAGGRSARLGGTAKAALQYDGETLLARSLGAVQHARSVVVVGPRATLAVPPGILLTQESPAFGGPAAGIAAGVAELPVSGIGWTVVLACDMPTAAAAVEQLIEAAPACAEMNPDAEVLMAEDNGKLQPLAALYRSAALRRAVEAAESAGGVQGMSVFGLIASLQVVPVQVNTDVTRDVDTWDDARSFGIVQPADEVH